MPPNGLTLWGVGTVRQLRPHWMLAELGLDYEYHAFHPRSGQTITPEFLAINPRHKVPVLRHGALLITESCAITQYLSDAFQAPAGVYAPRDALGRAMVAEWCYFAMTELDAHALYIIRKHSDLKHLYGDAPLAVSAAREYFADQFNAVVPRIERAGEFLVGGGLSVADIVLVTTLDWALSAGLPIPAPARIYRDRLAARPGYRFAYARTFPGAVPEAIGAQPCVAPEKG
jgi:glutathione S-transferase